MHKCERVTMSKLNVVQCSLNFTLWLWVNEWGCIFLPKLRTIDEENRKDMTDVRARFKGTFLQCTQIKLQEQLWLTKISDHELSIPIKYRYARGNSDYFPSRTRKESKAAEVNASTKQTQLRWVVCVELWPWVCLCFFTISVDMKEQLEFLFVN